LWLHDYRPGRAGIGYWRRCCVVRSGDVFGLAWLLGQIARAGSVNAAAKRRRAGVSVNPTSSRVGSAPHHGVAGRHGGPTQPA
jgi:hypothetical protein